MSEIAPIGNTNLFSASLEGMRRGFAMAAASADKLAQGDVSPDNVVGQIQASVLVKANAVTARTADEILGSILDMKA